jgi:asparagine N-glycosylation enzyme membrane subunit Stt3
MARQVPADRGAAAWPVVAVAAGLVVLAQLVGLYLPRPPDSTAWFPGADKLGHALAFALPVVLVPWADTLRRRAAGRPPRARVLVLVVWVSVAHAVVSELVQYAAYSDRVGDPLDVLADLSGIAIGGLLAGVGLTMGRFGGRRPGALSEWTPVDG